VPEQSMMGFPLSPQQKHLWLLQGTESAHPFYARCAVAIAGPLDADLLAGALRDVVRRHEICRTRFVVPEGMKLPLQIVTEGEGATLSRHDLSALDETAAQTELARLWDAMTLLEKPLAAPPLAAALAAFSPLSHRLFLGLPALCADAVGLDNLLADLVRSYAARAGQGEPPVEPLQYADLAEWQNETLKSPGAQPGRELWRQRFPSSAPPLVLPFAAGRGAGGPFSPQVLPVPLAPQTVAALESLAGTWGVPASLVWLGCWQALLACLCGERDLLLGVVLAGRSYADLEEVPGLFARCLPLRSTLDPGLDMAQWAAGLRQSIQEMEKWQECFDWEDVAPGGAPSYLPMGFEEQPRLPAFRAGEVAFPVVAREAHADRFDLKLVVGPGRAAFHYDGSLFRGTDVQRLGDQLGALVESLLREPGARILDLSMVGAGEAADLARSQEMDGAPPREPGSLIGRFEEQAALRGGEPALVFESRTLTWSELDGRANQLAHHLIRLGVGPETLVGVLLERSIEMVVALLAVLKAGGAYVPLDPQQPRERLRLMIQETRAKVLLTLGQSSEEPIATSVRTVRLDADWPAIGRESTGRPDVATAPESLVYVLFTSGSTGAPKGVAVEQRQLLNYLEAIVRKLGLPPGSHYAMVSTFAADLGNTVLFPALTTGGCLHLISPETAGDAEALAACFESRVIDALKIVPSHFQALLGAARPERIVPRRCLVLGGEACPWDLVDRVRSLRPECRVLNHYGPTETTVGVLVSELSGDRCGPWASAPIGRPLANTRAHLLDAELRPVPWGAPGDLYVAGAGLARGYLHRPDATAERFVPDPFGGEPGGRLYRTGDLARLNPDGELVFMGRADQQVKLRGFRIEPGEIEAAMKLHPAVREAAVTARGDGPTGIRLVGYFVASPAGLADDDLRAWVRERLPEPMVPALFVRLAAMPLTPNGKLDRRALPAPEQLRPVRAYVAPRDAVEEALAGIWAEILKLDRVGIHDNFFDLGGDSILGIQIVARANRQGMRLLPRQVFEKQTIAELALVVGTAEAIAAEPGLVTGPVPLIPVQRAFFERALPDPHHYNQSLLLESGERLRAPLIAAAVRALLLHHEALRLRFHHDEAGWQQRASAESAPAFSCLDLGGLPPETRDGALETAAAAIQASLDLSHGPLLRVALFQLGAGRADHLLLVAHHLVVDGVSWRILLEDFQTAYEQLGRGREIELAPKTSSFRQWAEHLAQYSSSEALRQELPCWLSAARREVRPLPRDGAAGEPRQALARSVQVTLTAEETRLLLQEVPKAYGTQINDALLTALVEACGRWTGDRTLLLDLEGHGREEDIASGVDLSRTVGWLTSVYPVLLDLRGILDAGEALKGIKEQLREIPRRGIGYGVLRYLADEETAARLAALPASAVSFNYLGQLDQVLPSSSQLRLSPLSAGPARSARGSRRYIIQIVGRVEGGRLLVSWTYSEEVHRRETVQTLADSFISALRLLIQHCQSRETASYTPSDFPEADLSQEELDTLLAQLDGAEEPWS
jgi:amino acid adenylation domain-containing protein/non-ribosomal peptide synthase protein (TIGR01720 family)